jgi:hypothetical protein
MIKFSLICQDGGHEFEGWFQSGAAYEAQLASEQLVCPHCGSHAIDKAIMAPAVARSAEREPRATKKEEHAASDLAAAAPETKIPPQELHRLLRQYRQEVHAKAEYVGGRFAEEARRIHFDESPARGIYGEASADEAKELAEDGIPFLPVPRLPEDLN